MKNKQILFSMTGTIINGEEERERERVRNINRDVDHLFGEIREGFTEEVTSDLGPEERVEIQPAARRA